MNWWAHVIEHVHSEWNWQIYFWKLEKKITKFIKITTSTFYRISFIFSLLTCSGTLARLIDFLLSPLFLHTYSDAITLGSISMNITPQAKKLIEKPFPQSPQIHISRVDTFLLLLEALSFSVQRLVLSLSSCHLFLLSPQGSDNRQDLYNFIHWFTRQ